MEATPRVVRRGRMTGTFSRRFYKLAANNVCKLLARTRQARELKTRLASIENFMDDPSVKEVAREIRVLVRTVALDREVLQRDLSCKPTLAQFAKERESEVSRQDRGPRAPPPALLRRVQGGGAPVLQRRRLHRRSLRDLTVAQVRPRAKRLSTS